MKELPFALDFSLSQWREWTARHELLPFCAEQIFQWIFQKGALDPQDPASFTNLSFAARSLLSASFHWELPRMDCSLSSQDGSDKFILQTRDGHLFEMVLMPSAKRMTLCVSSQIGCKRGCSFCQTAKMGFKRNLSPGEILSQWMVAKDLLKKRERSEKRISHIVFMGMGEPLDNYDAVLQAASILVDPKGGALSRSHVTISTAGHVPLIRALAQALPLRLAVSLHSADDRVRSELMPINCLYPLKELKRALLEYPAKREGITFEYLLIEGKNDSLLDARRLVSFLHGLKAKVNLILFNHFPGSSFKRSQEKRVQAFQAYLAARFIPAPIRNSRAQDVSGGCGQLAAKREGELHLDPRTLFKKRKK